ncbi:MAG: DUF721 domain-containing protein [Thermodesulfovibrionales bacterium]
MGLKELGSTIEGLYKDLGLSEKFILGCIKNKWPQIVGEGLSIHSEPFSINNGELLIKVSSHLWAEELRFHSDSIVEKLKPYKVKTVKFRIGKITSENRNRPSIVEPLSQPPAELSGFIESCVCCIDDEKLRESIKKAMRRSLTVSFCRETASKNLP